jgi:hypothetical protein
VSDNGYPFCATLAFMCNRGTPHDLARFRAREAVDAATANVYESYGLAHFLTQLHFDRTVARAAINWAISQWYRGRKRAMALGDSDPAEPEVKWTDEYLARLPRALAGLAPDERLLVRLRVYENWTFEQLAVIFHGEQVNTNTAIGWIRTRLIELTQRLRPLLEGDEDDEDGPATA